MTITIYLTMVQQDMLKELQKKDQRYRGGLAAKVIKELQED
jgi:hypothetical protein